MKSMRTWLIGAAVVAGGLGLGVSSAQAQYARYDQRPVVHVSHRYEGGYVYGPAYRYDYSVQPVEGRRDLYDRRDRYDSDDRYDHDGRYNRDEGRRDFDRRGDRDRRR